MQNSFTEDDKKKFIDFLNAVANHAEFKLNTQELCEYFKLLAHMQQVMLPKIHEHILEVIEVGIHDQAKYDESMAENSENSKDSE
jgi:hypothetical protein